MYLLSRLRCTQTLLYAHRKRCSLCIPVRSCLVLNSENSALCGEQCRPKKNAAKLLDKINSGEAHYHFVEIMGGPGGCVNGGGQPIQSGNTHNFEDVKGLRASALYNEDAAMELRQSHNNPIVQEVYSSYLGKPGSEKAHHILHTTYTRRNKYWFLIDYLQTNASIVPVGWGNRRILYLMYRLCYLASACK